MKATVVKSGDAFIFTLVPEDEVETKTLVELHDAGTKMIYPVALKYMSKDVKFCITRFPSTD